MSAHQQVGELQVNVCVKNRLTGSQFGREGVPYARPVTRTELDVIKICNFTKGRITGTGNFRLSGEDKRSGSAVETIQIRWKTGKEQIDLAFSLTNQSLPLYFLSPHQFQSCT